VLHYQESQVDVDAILKPKGSLNQLFPLHDTGPGSLQ
jgi:hypothetical protein